MVSDPFDDFAREMGRRTQQEIVNDALHRVGQKPNLSEQDKRDRALLSAMKDYPLKPGQMLLLGPKSVALLSTPGAYAGTLPDKYILDRSDWAVV